MKPEQIKHWIVVLERIKTEFMWTPYDQFPTAETITELIEEMRKAVEETERSSQAEQAVLKRTADQKG